MKQEAKHAVGDRIDRLTLGKCLRLIWRVIMLGNSTQSWLNYANNLCHEYIPDKDVNESILDTNPSQITFKNPVRWTVTWRHWWSLVTNLWQQNLGHLRSQLEDVGHLWRRSFVWAKMAGKNQPGLSTINLTSLNGSSKKRMLRSWKRAKKSRLGRRSSTRWRKRLRSTTKASSSCCHHHHPSFREELLGKLLVLIKFPVTFLFF